MNPLLVNDLVLLEDNCNLSCEYCLTAQSRFKSKHDLKMIFEPPRPASYAQGELRSRIVSSLMSCEKEMNLPIIKVTGGEIFLISGIMEFLGELSNRYATVVIQTNGTLLNQNTLAEIKSWGNACLQISLDAVSFKGNAYRSPTTAIHEITLRKFEAALDAGIPSEIYSVLTDHSVPALEETLEYLMRWKSHVVIAPFPVRGPERQQYSVMPEQISELRRVLSQERYAKILPPPPYIARLISFMEHGQRSFRCHLPRLAFTLFDDGVVTPCPNIWFTQVGNLLVEDARNVLARLGKGAFYDLLLAPRPRLDACKHCFTPWDMLSIFLDGEMTLDELCRTPMYAAPATRARIIEIAAKIQQC